MAPAASPVAAGAAPAPDWYPDPERPNGLRYWDGNAWTDHRHSNVERAPSGLPKIGDGFGQWIAAITNNLKQVALLTLALSLPGMVLMLGGMWIAIRQFGFDTRTDTVEAPPTAMIVVGGLLFLLGIVLSLFFRVAMTRLMWDAHTEQPISAMGAAKAVAGRLGRVLVGYGVPFIAYLAVVGGIIALAVFAGPVALVLLVLLLPLGIWLFPYLGMYEVAIAAGPRGESPFAGARRFVRGRWGAIAGRTLLASIAASVGGSMMNSGASVALVPLTSGMGSSAVEMETLPNGDIDLLRNGVPVDEFQISELFPTGLLIASLLIFAVVYGISTGLQHSFNASALTHMATEVEELDGTQSR